MRLHKKAAAGLSEAIGFSIIMPPQGGENGGYK
jgi:hypothetical protein